MDEFLIVSVAATVGKTGTEFSQNDCDVEKNAESVRCSRFY